MRRGIGVAHIQQKQQSQQQMAQLGAQITAERVVQVEEQLASLQSQLRTLAGKHKDEIRHDPVVRARFRQLADSLGIDLISSKKNIFAGALGLGDFYYSLAGKVVEVCLNERKFCGSFVPLQRAIAAVQKSYDNAIQSDKGSRTVVSEGDVLTALGKLSKLGAGYNVVELSGVKYIQTTPDDSCGTDQVRLLNYVLQKQQKKIEAEKKKRISESRKTAPRLPASKTSTTSSSTGPRIGAAFVLADHPLQEVDEGVVTSIPLCDQCVTITERELGTEMGWEPHRVNAVLQRMVQEGSIWVEHSGDQSKKGKALPILSATEGKNSSKKSKEEKWDSGSTYWFISLTTYA